MSAFCSLLINLSLFLPHHSCLFQVLAVNSQSLLFCVCGIEISKRCFACFVLPGLLFFLPLSPEIPVGVPRIMQDGCLSDPPDLCIMKFVVKVLWSSMTGLFIPVQEEGQRADSE